jgi:hypothetical protein
MVSVSQGIHFEKDKSKKVARYTIGMVFIVNISIYVPQILALDVYTDKIEERNWCVVTYSSFIRNYSSTSIMFHYFGPLLSNIISAVYIITSTTYQRSATDIGKSFWFHLKAKVKHYKHLLISPIIITTLTLPHLIISIILDCNKSSHLLWFYITGYFLSFAPSAFIFFIFVPPSPVYQGEFQQLISSLRRRFDIFKLNTSRCRQNLCCRKRKT